MKLCENFLKTLYTQFNPPFLCIWLVFIYLYKVYTLFEDEYLERVTIKTLMLYMDPKMDLMKLI